MRTGETKERSVEIETCRRRRGEEIGAVGAYLPGGVDGGGRHCGSPPADPMAGAGWRGGKNLSCCCIVSGWPPLEPSSAPLLVCPLGHETPDASTCVGFSAVFGPFPFRSFFLLFFC
jgi:hypothetical protein